MHVLTVALQMNGEIKHLVNFIGSARVAMQPVLHVMAVIKIIVLNVLIRVSCLYSPTQQKQNNVSAAVLIHIIKY